MVIPWVGYSMSEFISAMNPLPSAKYVQFISLADPKQMPGLASPVLDWPYSEGLRLDEAMNPLTLLPFGLYGQVLPNQDGAPVRVVVPWKYGFKSVKSIAKIRFVEKQPFTTWMRSSGTPASAHARTNSPTSRRTRRTSPGWRSHSTKDAMPAWATSVTQDR